MRILERRFLQGPNRHAPQSLLRLATNFGALSRMATRSLGREALEQLVRIVPSLPARADTGGKPGEFGRELEQAGVGIPWLVLRLADALIDMPGEGQARSAILDDGGGNETIVLLSCDDPEVGARAWQLASRLVAAVTPAALSPPVQRMPLRSFSEPLRQFQRLVRLRRLDLVSEALVAAAAARGIPAIRWRPLPTFIQLGYGPHQRHIQGTILDSTGHLAAKLAMDKEISARLLATQGLPIPMGEEVFSAADAETAAKKIGFPVVIKPARGLKGMNVFVGLSSASEARTAFAEIAKTGERVLVQRLVPGEDHRLLVVGGKLVAAAHRVPARVVGDGVHSVAQLVEELNADPRRGTGYEKVLVRVVMDEEAHRLLGEAGLQPESVPEAGQIVPLRRTANISSGGTAEDVTDRVHADNRELAERAAQAIGLNVAGVDFITTDIGRSYRDIGGAILEVNPGPGLRPHWLGGPARDVVGPIVELLFPPGQNGRIPTAVITGSVGKTTTARMVAAILGISGKTVGLASTDGVYLGGERVRTGDLAGGRVAQQLLQDRRVEAGVFEIARGSILTHGLVLDDYDVGAVLNVLDEHVGIEEIHSLEEMARIKRLAVEHAREVAVLNADDKHCREMIPHARAKRVCLVSDRQPPEPLLSLLDRDGCAVGVEGRGKSEQIVLHDGGRRTPVMRVSDIPATYGGLARVKVHNAAFAVAIAHGLGVSIAEIRSGMKGFVADMEHSPGRLNRYDGHPFTVVTDMFGAPAGLAEAVKFAEALPVRGRRLMTLTAPGNRSDLQIREMGRVGGGHFAHFVLYDWSQLRGRTPGEVPKLLHEGLRSAGVDDNAISVVLDQTQALDTALRMARPGDLLLVCGFDYEATWRQIVEFRPDAVAPDHG